MPLSDKITVTTRTGGPPLGVPSLQIPICACLLTTAQRVLWTTTYTSDVNVVEITGATWQAVLETLGVTTGEDIQVALADMFSQRIGGAPAQPALALLALREVPVAHVITVTLDAFTAGDYTIVLNGNDIIVTGSVDEPTTAGLLRTAINDVGQLEPITASGAGADVILTADEAGVPMVVSTDHSTTPASISQVVTTANVGLPEDITAWDAEDPRGYLLLETTCSERVVRAAADAWEIRTGTLPGMFFGQVNDPLAQTGASALDVASLLTALSYARTRVYWHDNDDQFVAWADAAKMLSESPGVQGPEWNTLSSVSGISAPVLSSAATLETKRYSFLESYNAFVPPKAVTRGGKMVDGQWADIVYGIDGVNRTVEVRTAGMLIDGNVPYNGSASQIEGAIRGALAEFEGAPGEAFLVAGSVAVTILPAASQTVANVALRHRTGNNWSALAQGKLSTIAIQGFLDQ